MRDRIELQERIIDAQNLLIERLEKELDVYKQTFGSMAWIDTIEQELAEAN